MQSKSNMFQQLFTENENINQININENELKVEEIKENKESKKENNIILNKDKEKNLKIEIEKI